MTDPRELLGIPLHAEEEEIRAAYLRKVKEFPPDRSPEEFERIRDAFEILRDPRKSTRALLVSTDPGAPLVRLLDNYKARRLFVGPQAWREVLKAK